MIQSLEEDRGRPEKRQSSMQKNFPGREGHFGLLGGKYVPETLMDPLIQLERAYRSIRKDPSFQKELNFYLKDYAGRPTPLYFAKRLTEEFKGQESTSSAKT
jgi:tryptophan synthase beta chain